MATAKTKKVKEENPDSLRVVWREICHKQKGLMATMMILAVLSAILLVFSLSVLKPQNTVVIVGYSDVYGEVAGITGGYRRDSWLNMLAFPLLAILYGVVHNLLVMRIYRKYGRDAAILVAGMTMLLLLATFVVIFRLTGEW